jgi:hypothetical protein
MMISVRRLLPLAPLLIAMLGASPALALEFRVHGYDLGERISLSDGRRVYTAELEASVEGIEGRVDTFCVDLDTTISSPASYHARALIDAYTGVSPEGERPRDFAWAGHVVDHFAVDTLAIDGITRRQAITGVQSAIWEGIYGGGIVNVGSLSTGARSVYEQIMGSVPSSLSAFAPTGRALIVELDGVQDQVFSSPVPEPGAAMLFGLGIVLAGRHSRRR